MKYLKNTKTLCLEYAEYVQEGIITEVAYWHQREKGRKEITVHGNGPDALIEFESLPHKYRAKIIAKYGDPYEYAAKQPILKLVKKDDQARRFYAEDYRLPTGDFLPAKHQSIYSRQADWLNMISICLEDKKMLKEMLHIPVLSFWQNVIELHKRDKITHKLPTSEKRLRMKHKTYEKEGYAGLVEVWRFTNQHARIVTPKIEDLLMALYARRHGRATLTQVVKDYNRFITGGLELIDLETGEIFNPKDFVIKDKFYELSPATVSYYANLKHNRERIDLIKLGYHDYVQKHKPHNRRIGAKYAFSKISMDDYLPPFKTLDGKRTVWMYVIFDCASKAIVGVGFGTKKGHEIVDEALRDMIRLCIRKGWGIPAEIELERSLNYERRGSKDKPDLFTAGEVFPFVRFTKGGNSQEKLAEGFLRSFKYEQLADEEGFLGRPHGRNENFRLNRDKKEGRYMVKELIARLKKYVEDYNNSPISDKDDTTRWQFLCENQHPAAIHNRPETIMPYIGIKTETSIHRRVARIKNDWYEVPNDLTWKRDINGRAKVDAYWIPGEDQATPEEVYLYQEGKFICAAKQQDRYHDAQIERTAEDWKILGRQSARQKAFERRVKEGLSKMPVVDVMQSGAVASENVRFVSQDYDKLAQEEEEYAEVLAGENDAKEASQDGENERKNTQKRHKKPTKEGGYVHFFDPDKIANDAISML